MKKLYRIVLLLTTLIFLSTYSPSEFNLTLEKNSDFLKIKKIIVKDNFLIKTNKIEEKLIKVYK